MRHFIYFLLFITINLTSLTALSQNTVEAISVNSISQIQPWEFSKTQLIKINIKIPYKFHAYSDKFKIKNMNPNDFAAGEINLPSEINFYDKHTQKTRKGIENNGELTFIIEPSNAIATPLQVVNFDLQYQICSESVCYLPQTIALKLTPNSANSNGASPANVISEPITDGFSTIKSIEQALQSSLLLAFLSVFIAGILTSFTPCIFPMLPITISILGYHANQKSRFHNFSRALAYVLGIAITYSSLGVIAALTGSLFGSALTNKYVLTFMVLLFMAMALSMWGVFEIQSPAFIRNKFGTGKTHSLGGAFFMGLVAGIVASPCVGPVLISILSYVSTTKNALLGFSLLFTYAIGLGMIFIVIGLFSSALKLLPKSGLWMDFIKFALGAGMWGAALYYAQFILDHRWWVAFVALSFTAFSAWKGAFAFRKKDFFKQSLLLVVFTFSITVFILSFLRPDYLHNAFAKNNPSTHVAASANWQVYSEELLKSAIENNQPVMVDFFAEWCAACHELDKKTFSTDEFKELSKEFMLLRFDATEDNTEITKVLQKYNVKGLPTVLFINRNGIPNKELTFTQFLEINELKPKMQEALK